MWWTGSRRPRPTPTATPTTSSTELTAALAAKFGVDVEPGSRVGCGSVSLCTQLVQAVADADDEVIYAWRSFEAYPIIAAVSGASSIQVPLARSRPRPRRDGRRDHRQDATGVRLQSEQPHRHGGPPRRSWLRSCAPCRGRRDRPGRGLPRVRHRPRRAGRHDVAGRAPERRRAADVLQGLRAGRTAGRLRDRGRSGARLRAAADAGAVRGHHGCAGRRRWPASSPRPRPS